MLPSLYALAALDIELILKPVYSLACTLLLSSKIEELAVSG